MVHPPGPVAGQVRVLAKLVGDDLFDFLFHPASRLSVVNEGIIGSAKVTVDGVDRKIALIDTFLLLPMSLEAVGELIG